MYQIALAVQIVAILFCAVGTFFLYYRVDKVVSKNLLASSLFAMIFGIGYLMEMMARSEGAALYSLVTQYIGLAFTALFFAIYATERFNYIHPPKVVWGIIFVFNLSTFVAVLTSGVHNFYYKERTFVETGLFPHLETTNSVWFYIFMALLFCCILYSAVLFFIALLKSEREGKYLFAVFAMILGILFMWVSFAVGFNGYEPVSALVCIILGITSFFMMGSKTSVILNEAYAECYLNSSVGQVIITKDNRFIECNKIAKKFFPEFEHYKRMQPIVLEGEGVSFNRGDGKLFVGDRCYAINYQKLEGAAKAREGRIITMTDVTVLENQRTIDPLTGLYNRHGYYDKVQGILSAGAIYLSILIVDLNGLKIVNDTQGHSEGDHLIMGVADCLLRVFTKASIVFRFGGDEFVVVSTAGEQEFTQMLEAMPQQFEKANETRTNKLSVSCGSAGAVVASGLEVHALMKTADQEMYINKKKYYEENHIERRHS